ncbi:MAG TPA: DUF4157 domain-containing protein [Actinoplanes sp.]|nr:DUF4157 domain-containing protein [Actinoplanes sp.]
MSTGLPRARPGTTVAETSETSEAALPHRPARHVPELLQLQEAGGNAMVGRLLRDADGGSAPGLAARVRERQGGGEALPAGLSARFAPMLGGSLSGVRIHRDAAAAELANAAQARAFTAGTDVFFAAGAYQPGTPTGEQLLAHELAHTVQNSSSAAASTLISAPGDRAEVAADNAARQATLGKPASVGTAGAALIHRSPAAGATATVDPVAAEAETQAMSEQLAARLLQEHHLMLAEYQRVHSAHAELLGPRLLTDEQQAQAAELSADKTNLEKQLRANEEDLVLLTDPSSTVAARQAVIARRGSTASIGQVTAISLVDGQVSDAGLVWSSTTTSSNMSNGTAGSSTKVSSHTFTPTSATWASSDTKSQTAGDLTTSKSESDERSVALDKGSPTYSLTKGTSEKSSNSATGYSKDSSSTTTRTAKGGSFSSGRKDTERAGDHEYSTESTNTYGFSGGKYGMSSTTTHTDGTVDDEGKLVSGSSTSTTRDRGAVFGPDGVGAYAGHSGSADRTFAKGVKAGVSAGLDGRFTVAVTERPDAPGSYQIVLTISLGGQAGVSGSADRGMKGSLSGSASGKVSMQYAHLLTEAEAARYLAALHDVQSHPVGAAFPELAILGTAVTKGDEAAIAMVGGVQSSLLGDPSAAAGLPEGDSITVAASAEVGGDLSAGVKKFGVSAGGTVGTGLEWTVTRSDGQVVLAAKFADDKSGKLGATGSVGLVSGGFDTTGSSSRSQTFRFRLNPSDPEYAAHYAQIIGSAGMPELKALAQAHPELVDGTATTSGSKGSNKFSAGIGPLLLGITDTESRTSSTATDRAGRQSFVEAGSGGGGIDLSLGGIPLVQHSGTGAITTTVKDGRFDNGDVSTTTSNSDWTATLKALVDVPVKGLWSLLTGDAKITQDVDVAGMKLTEADFLRIAATARDRSGWTQALLDGRGSVINDLKQWNACGSRIASATAPKEIAAALADFIQGGSSRRASVVQAVVRGRGSAQGGSRYEWPSELANHREAYTTLVEGDPLAAIDAAQQAGQFDKAGRLALDAVTKLDAVAAAMKLNQAAFVDESAYGEMLEAVVTRRAELTGRAHLAAKQVPLGPVDADTARAQAQARLDGLMIALNGYQDMQTRVFGEVKAEQAKADEWFDKPDVVFIFTTLNDLKDKVYPLWWDAFEEAGEAAKAAGRPAPEQPKPDVIGWKQLERITLKN